jgi:integrase/recombinase XerD
MGRSRALSEDEVHEMLDHLATTRYPKRNRLIFLLSVRAGLRAREIAELRWWSCNDPEGQVAWQLNLLDSSGRPGRVVPLSTEVRQALIAYRDEVTSFSGPHVISTERSLATSAQVLVNAFQRWYRQLGFVGCSSHSGRRTFIADASRKISTSGGSLKDVQRVAGHANLRTTKRFLEDSPDVQTSVMNLVKRGYRTALRWFGEPNVR